MSPKFQDFPSHIDQITAASLNAVSPENAVRRFLSRDDGQIRAGERTYTAGVGSVHLVSVGKASVRMGVAAAAILGDLLEQGIVIAKAGQDIGDLQLGRRLPPSIDVHWASHPVSDQRSIQATKAVLGMLADVAQDEMVLCLISGGTSALLTKPVIPLKDYQLMVTALLESGCTINELNAVRRSIDLVKGGGLLAYIAPARCVSLILSDVVGNPLDVIGSGPTVPAPASRNLARQVLERYRISSVLPSDSWNALDSALFEEEQTMVSRTLEVDNLIIGDVGVAARAARTAAEGLGFQATVLTCHLEGEAREVGKVGAALARDLDPGSCLILGGETTVTVKGGGLGGRNQELVLAAAIAIDGLENALIASFATDGDDGPTGAAGAFCTGETCAKARAVGLDPQHYLGENDSYTFFSTIGELVVTGPTGTNVNDLLFIFRYAE